MKLNRFIIQFIFWLQAWAAPVLLCGLIGIFTGNKSILLVLLVIGCGAGIVLAEYIRRKIGLDIFFSRIFGSNNLGNKISDNKTDSTT